MRLCTFGMTNKDSKPRLGLVEGTRVFEVEGIQSMLDYLLSADSKVRPAGEGYDLTEVSLRAPLPRPGKIVAAIVNTRAMLGGDDVSLDRPRLEMKAPSAVVGNGAIISAPASGIRPEVELAAIVGRRISKATPEQALNDIAGYTVLNDITAPRESKEDAYEAYRRDPKTGEVKKTVTRGPLFRSKNHDGFCPMGPVMVTPDDLGNTAVLKMTTKFDGRVVQDGSTGEYIFTPSQIASYVSGFLTLEPGDVVTCGTPGLTKEALGRLDPTEYVLPGGSGTLEVEVERIGALINPVVFEK